MTAGQHVNSIGSTGLQLREVDPETFARADRVVTDSRVQLEAESGDVHAARQAGTYDRAKVTELKKVAAGCASDRTGPGRMKRRCSNRSAPRSRT